jgi:hypothetical protein
VINASEGSLCFQICKYYNITSKDIIFLYETWTSKTSKIDIDGYTTHNLYRKFQHRRAKRSSGGTAIYYKNYLKGGIHIVRNHYDTVIWLKLDKDFFSCCKRYLFMRNIFMV